jgi:pantetheine-phosphate adenylyltransferase
MKVGFYAGSFDPITLGHLDIIEQAARVFDRLHVEIGINPRKTPMFSISERADMIEETLAERRQRSVPGQHHCTIEVGTYSGALMDRADALEATAIVRGLRQISDFNDEFTINGMVSRLLPEVPMVYFICHHEFLHVSSSSAKELARYGYHAEIDWMVGRAVRDKLRAQFE